MSQTTVNNFVTVVSVGTRDIPENTENVNIDSNISGYVTVLTIGDDNDKDLKQVTEEVIVYRLPGERLGFGLKFEGGTKASEYVKKLFIQSCAADSPASLVKSSWGKLTEGDEVLAIDSVPVNTMTRIDCVRCLKDSNVAIKLLVRHSYNQQYKNETEIPPLIISAEEKRVPPPPPPVPPRKISRKILKNINNNIPKETLDNVVDNNNAIKSSEPTKQKKLQSPRSSIRSYNSPDALKRDRRFSDGSLGPPDAEVYVDLFLKESTQSLSESDDTGSTISTVIDKFGSFPTTTTSSFSGSLPSTPTAVQRQLDISNVNIYEDDDLAIISKGIGKPIPVAREENNNIVLDEVNPLCFQDAPLSYGNESTKNLVSGEIENSKEERVAMEDNKQMLKKPPVPPRSKDTHLFSAEESNKYIENLPRLVDFVPKFTNGVKEVENTTEVMTLFLENERYKIDFEYYDQENENMDPYINEVDMYNSKWSLSSQLATIGEVEEEGSSDFNFNRTASKSTPVVIVENTEIHERKNKSDDLKTTNIETNESMATLPSDSRQPPDGHEFPDFIEDHREVTVQNYHKNRDIDITVFHEDFSKGTRSVHPEDFPKPNSLITHQPVSTSNTDLSAKMYESAEDLNYNHFHPEPITLHTRSQSLIDVSALSKKNTKWNQLFEQRRKGLSKLKGLVIPEATENDFSSNVDIPEIKSQTPPLYFPVPKLSNNFSSTEAICTNEDDLLRPSIVVPSWSSNASGTLPKYSPAFKRKSLQVYPTSISKHESNDYSNNDFPKYCDKINSKVNKVNDDDLNPPKSLESISSPTRSDCSFDYISSSKKYSKANSDSLQKLNGRIEDESDNDSAVSSSQSSYNSRYSPPSSPTRSCEINHYSKKIYSDDDKSAQNRLLKPSSVEAINRKNILASAKCRSGKDLKIGSPVIRRKQEEQANVHIINRNGEIDLQKSESAVTAQRLNGTPALERNSQSPEDRPQQIRKSIETTTFNETHSKTRAKPDIRHNETPTKVSTKNLFLTLNSSTLNHVPKKLPEDAKDKSKDFFNSNSKSRKPAPINVKALKKSFESLSSPQPMPQKVPIFKPTTLRRNSRIDDTTTENKVSESISNSVSEYQNKKAVEKSNKIDSTKCAEVGRRTIILKTDCSGTSLGITLSGGVDENKEITIHRIRYSSVAYHDGHLKRGDKIISINGKPTNNLSHTEAVDLLKEPVTEFSIVIEEGENVVPSPISSNNSSLQRRSSSLSSVLSGTKSPSLEVLEEKKANCTVSVLKDLAGLGFSIEGGKDSPQGDVPLLVKKIFTGGAAEKSGNLKVGDEIIQINNIKFTNLTRIEAWNAMKKISDGNVEIHVYRYTQRS